MAYVFYAAIHQALSDGKVKPAAAMEDGLADVQGDDPEGVVDPELPIQPGNPIE